MTITYPLSFPSSIKLSTVAPTLQFINGVSRSPFTGERQAFRWPGEVWSLQYTTPPCLQAVADDWIAFAMKLRGSYGTFLLGDITRTALTGAGGGTPLAAGAQAQGLYDLNIDGCPNSVTWAKKGDYFQLGTGASAHLHKLVEDAVTNGSGQVTLQFVPATREAVADNAPIVVANTVGVFSLVEDSITWSVDQNGHYRYSFTAQEAL